eukprot:SAG22_NODE_4580_length_1226_cov_1.893523_1_plen_149_part_10
MLYFNATEPATALLTSWARAMAGGDNRRADDDKVLEALLTTDGQAAALAAPAVRDFVVGSSAEAEPPERFDSVNALHPAVRAERLGFGPERLRLLGLPGSWLSMRPDWPAPVIEHDGGRLWRSKAAADATDGRGRGEAVLTAAMLGQHL